MKKVFLILGAALMAASCTTITKTATTADTPASLLSTTVAELEVSPERVVRTIIPEIEVRRGGLSNVKRHAEQKVLSETNADVLVDAEYSITQTNYLIFGKKIESITISGHPAKYKNFHSLNDSVWCNPTFRYFYKDDAKKSSGGILNKLFGK